MARKGIAVALAESGAGPSALSGTSPAGATSTATNRPASPESDTLATVPPATTPTSPPVTPPGTRAAATPTPRAGTTASTSGNRKSSTAAPKSTTGRARTSAAPPKSTTAAKPSVSASKPTVAPAPVRPPVRLRIPAIGVDAPVGPVGINDRGEMAIPEQVSDIGWYEYGPAPGATQGSAVLSGHVDSAQQGLGAFSRLGDLKAGDVITVTDAAGRQLTYRVVGKEAFDKKTVPLADLFSRSGAARLTLITCGGAFDSAALSYVDNIVVTALPA